MKPKRVRARGPRIAYWWDVIREAKRRKVPFSPQHVKRADEWGLCACGKLDGSVLRLRDLPPLLYFDTMAVNPDEPIDRTLRDLGLVFSAAVSDQDVEKAERTMLSIEARVALLRNRPEDIEALSQRIRDFARSWKPPKAETKRAKRAPGRSSNASSEKERGA